MAMTYYDIWEYPETNGITRGRRRDLYPHCSQFTTEQGAINFFCACTGWKVKDITANGDFSDMEFYHSTLNYVGGLRPTA